MLNSTVVYMYKIDWALNNLKWLIYHKTKPTLLRERRLYQKYDELKPVNCVQTKENLLIQKKYKYSFRNLRLNVYTYKQNLVLNNQQKLICHKTQPTNILSLPFTLTCI